MSEKQTTRTEEPCDCKSHNAQVGAVPEVVLTIPKRFNTERETVCVDSCIAQAVLALWDHGIWTLGSCCGHRGLFTREIIVDRSDAATAAKVMKSLNDQAKILCWELIEPNAQDERNRSDAKLAAAEAEVERLNGLLREFRSDIDADCGGEPEGTVARMRAGILRSQFIAKFGTDLSPSVPPQTTGKE